MKAIKSSIWYDIMISTIKETIIGSFENSMKKNEIAISPITRREYKNEVDLWLKSLDFSLYYQPSIENVISLMVDERFNHEAIKNDLWIDIVKTTSKDPQLPYQMIIERADNVLRCYQERFEKQKNVENEN